MRNNLASMFCGLLLFFSLMDVGLLVVVIKMIQNKRIPNNVNQI